MKQTIKIGKRYYRADYGFIAILLLLLATSCFALYNAVNLIKGGLGTYYLQRQIMWYCVGFAAMFLVMKLQNEQIYQYVDSLYKVLLWVLIYMFLSKLLHSFTGHHLPFSSDINGAYSWLSFPLLSFQASEFMKIVLIIKTAQIIAKFHAKFPDPTTKEEIRMFVEIIRWYAVPMILILMQPDTGVFIIIGFTLVMMLICSGIRKMYLWIILGLIVGGLAGFFLLYFQFPDVLTMFIDQYKLNRIEAWLNPEEYKLGSANQLYTALLSLGSAGITGHGLQANIVSIPEAHTDFIFAAFGQSTGLIGTVFVVMVCVILDLYLCRLALKSTNQTDKMIIIGTIAMLFYQQFQNIGMIVGLIPITGITLPLISYGGSSTLSYFLLFGVIMNLSPVSKKSFKLRIPSFHIDETFRIHKPGTGLHKDNSSATSSAK